MGKKKDRKKKKIEVKKQEILSKKGKQNV